MTLREAKQIRELERRGGRLHAAKCWRMMEPGCFKNASTLHREMVRVLEKADKEVDGG